MSGLVTVFSKEVKENLRDRRTILSSFSLSVLGPALFIGLMSFVLNNALGESDDPVPFAVIGAGHAPMLLDYLEARNTRITRLEEADPAEVLASGTHEIVLQIDPDFGTRFASGRMAAVTLWHDSAGLGASRRHFRTLQGLIGGYAQTIGVLRLQLRGIDATIARPVVVRERDVASPAARALTVLATLPYLLVLVVFMGGFYLAIDATAGEREHGSLEPLLCQPISRTQLVLGKILAAAFFSAASLILFLASLAATLPFAPLEKVGMSLHLGVLQAAAIFAVTSPLMVFGAAVLTTVASFARSYKEAQTYLTIVVLIPTLPLIITQMLNVEPSAWLMLVPSLGQSLLVSQLIIGEPLDPVHVLLSVSATALAAAAFAWLAIRLYSRERILV